jgi:hypothetical protein
MIRRMPTISPSRYACALSAAALAALLSACSPSSPTAGANLAAGKGTPAKPAPSADPNPDLPEVVITASRTRGTPPTPEPKSARSRNRPRDGSS